MINLVIVGACGKMSSAVVSLITNEKDIKIVGGIESAGHLKLGMPIGDGLIQTDLAKIIEETDVVVEFAMPEITLDNIKIAVKANKPYIIGTTGITDFRKIKEYSKKIPIFVSANFSLGVNLLYRLTEDSAKILKDSDIEIIEAHHKMKRDAPSGTAKKLVEIINKTRTKSLEPKVYSIRAGDIVGEHTVMFIGNGERLELTHRATSRNAFALGVVKAIRFITKQKPGLYGMEHLLKF